MSITAIATELAVVNTRSADLPFIAGSGSGNAIAATSTTDGWVVSPPSGRNFDALQQFILGDTGTGGTVTFKAGDRVPGHLSDLGDLVITLASADGRVVFIETSRFLQSDGTINVIPSVTALILTCVMAPRGA